MKSKRFLLCCILTGLICLTASICHAQEINEIPAFTAQDRVLILAPHPDDETIGTGGILQRAIKAGAQVKVVCFTNGDANELAFIVYEKRLTFRKGEFLHMGQVRRNETMLAMKSLGLHPEDIIFLGYPDFGTMEILTKYWDTEKPYKSLFSRVYRVSYAGALSQGAPYVGESILSDLKSVVSGFKPTKIFVSHPADTNRDHRALYLFLRVALWDLEDQMSRPQIFPYIIHIVGWPKPRGYHPELPLAPPTKCSGVQWQKFSLTEDEVKTKKSLIGFYKSEIPYNPPYLFTYDRKNELYGDYPELVLKRQITEDVQWQGVEMCRIGEEGPEETEAAQKNIISSLAYAHQDDGLWVRITLKKKIDKEFGINVYLLGYNKNIAFSAMPKVRIFLGLLGAKLRDNKEPLKIPDFKVIYDQKTIILKVPLSSLGRPGYILSNSRAAGFPYEASAWRILKLSD